MEQHPIASVSDGVGTVLSPPGVDPHAGEGVSLTPQCFLQGRVVGGEAALRLVQVLVGAEGNFQRVVGAVEGKLVARARVSRTVDVALVIAHLVGEGKAREEVVRCRVHGGEIRSFPRRAVPDGKLQLDADAPRARAAQRCEKARVERVLKCRGLVLHKRLPL